MGALINTFSFWIGSVDFTSRSALEADVINTLREISVEQGIFLGWSFGVVLSLILIVALSLISKLRCPFRLGILVQIQIVKFSFFFWLAGGINTVLLVYFNPNYFDNLIDPSSFGLMLYPKGATPKILRGAWIFGSTLGIYIGLVPSTIGCLFSFAAKWRELEKR